tara:strand:- start:772 stop:1881 length:1110 start_codon:yes stop_codon:yes gene_type:complete
MQNIKLLEDLKEIQDFLKIIEVSQVISIDIEFMRRNTYFPEPCVIQVSDGENHSCIDLTLDIDYKKLFKKIFFDDKLIVFHSCRQDLEILQIVFGEIPKNIFDTQFAASFLGYKYQIGYAELTKSIFDIDINKSEKMTDWKKRPLSKNQIAYALNDVIYLNNLYSFLNSELIRTKKIDYFKEEMKNFINDIDWDPRLENAWKRIKSINSLEIKTKMVAKGISVWREGKAIELNIPRNWILSEKNILDISRAFIKSSEIYLPKNKYISINEDIREIKFHIKNQQEKKKDFIDRKVYDFNEYKKIADALYEYYKSISVKNNISYQIVSPKKMIFSFLKNKDSDSRLISGWRKELIDMEKISNITDPYFDAN